MASPGDGRRQPPLPLRILPEEPPQLWSFGRTPDGDARRWAARSLFGPPPVGHFNETERLLRVVLLEPSPLLALEEKPGPGSRGRAEPLFLPPGRSWHQLALDVAGFSAEELSVQLEGRKLTVLGKQEKEAAAEDGCVCRESRQLRRELLLPPDADLDALTCALGHDGHLRVQAPRRERPVPLPVERRRRRSPSEAGGAAGGAEEAAPAGGQKPGGADEQ